MQNEHLAELLTLARDSDNPVLGMGNDEETRTRAKALYKSLKRNVVLSDAKSIVVNVLNKNPFEAWRQLSAKYDPRNDAAAQRMIDLIMNKKHWKCAESLLREHLKRTGEEASNTISKRALFKSMLPDNVRGFLGVQTIFKPGLTYDVIKQAVMDLVQRTTNSATPMVVDSLSPYPGLGPGPGAGIGIEAPGSSQEQLDSLARRPPAGKPGKGDGKGGAGDKNGQKVGEKERETRACHNCGRVGHIVKDCWRPKKAKGQGKGADKPGHRERGPDGKWYRRTVNSWELDEDQQGDTGEPWLEPISHLEANRLGSGLEDEYVGLNDVQALNVCEGNDCEHGESEREESKVAIDLEEAIPGYANVRNIFVEMFRGRRSEPIDAIGDNANGDEEELDPVQESDSWTDHLALSGRTVGPRRKGNPVLTMAAKGADSGLDAFGTPPKPKPATQLEEMSAFATKFRRAASTANTNTSHTLASSNTPI